MIRSKLISKSALQKKAKEGATKSNPLPHPQELYAGHSCLVYDYFAELGFTTVKENLDFYTTSGEKGDKSIDPDSILK